MVTQNKLLEEMFNNTSTISHRGFPSLGALLLGKDRETVPTSTIQEFQGLHASSHRYFCFGNAGNAASLTVQCCSELTHVHS